jgi:amidase
VRGAAEALADAGYEVDEGEVPALREANDIWTALAFADINRIMHLLEQMASPDAVAFLKRSFAEVPPADDATWAAKWIERVGVARAWSEFLAKRPLILGPVATEPPFPPGADLTDEWPLSRILRAMRLVLPVNLLGIPAAAVPVGVADGLPQVVQVIGPRYREDACLDAAEVIEERVGTITPIDPIGTS